MAWWLIACIILFYVIYKLVESVARQPHLPHRTQKYLFITGCDTGFGNAAAKRLDLTGVNVFAGCYTQQGETVLKEQTSNRLKTVQLDVTKPESIQKAYEYVVSQLPQNKGLWGLVNNAGIAGSHIGPLDWLNADDHREVFNVNYFGMVNVTNVFLPLIKKEKGRIVNVASILGKMSMESMGPYVASKHAVEAFSDVLRCEVRAFGITVHVIEPTILFTNINAKEPSIKAFKDTWERMDQSKKDEYGENFFNDDDIDNYYKFGSADISPVVHAYEHALMAYLPKRRYLVGANTTLFWILMRIPDWAWDFVTKRNIVLGNHKS